MQLETTIIHSRDGKRVQFTPTGPLKKIELSNYFRNPGIKQSISDWRARKAATALTARFMIGCNVGQKPTWIADDIASAYIRLQQSRRQSPDLSMVVGSGAFTGENGLVEEEESVQLIIHEFGVSNQEIPAVGERFLVTAYTLAMQLLQESVATEILRRGQLRFSDLIQSGLKPKYPATVGPDAAKTKYPDIFFDKKNFPDDHPQWWGPEEIRPSVFPNFTDFEVAETVFWTQGQRRPK